MMQYPFHIESPLLLSRPLTNHIGIPVYLKMDSLQPTGSFKIRGLGYACWQAVKERGATSFVCASGGNAGFAVAYAGRCLGLPVTIVLPESTPVHIRHLLASHEQANVIVHGKVFNEADKFARELAEREGSQYIPPFDHPHVWQGNATIIHEIKKQLKYFQEDSPGVVVCSVGEFRTINELTDRTKTLSWSS
eukprot:TRINITY_DN1787_c0_g1_i3.p1 TRINITY_DN1787_c0_g1~~TRINITY_DN1787_c0_g1_i3.p1  ORF type:complete len:192 (+),score=26.44 TRINITY_DN1787_c0_g1_i3:26-601(+)